MLLLGAQAIGHEGVDKRIDVLATALKAGMTVHDLAELELAYAPPYGSAKDPVNLAGMAAQNVLAGDVALAQWNEVPLLDPRTTLLLDVRDPDERARGFIPGSTHIPLDELRQRLSELPRDREIIAYCRVRNLTGSYGTWRATQSDELPGDHNSESKKTPQRRSCYRLNISDRSPLWKSSSSFKKAAVSTLVGCWRVKLILGMNMTGMVMHSGARIKRTAIGGL